MERNCSSCVHHVPNSSKEPAMLTSGNGKGKLAYWVCELNSRGKYCEDGVNCKHYCNKYEDDKKLQEWRDKVYSVKTHHRVRVKELIK